MIAQARDHATGLPQAVQDRVTLIEADMRQLPADLHDNYALISLPYRTFQHLLTPADQLLALRGFRQHLAPGGRLVLNQFDPTLDMVRVLNEPEPSDEVSELPVDMEFVEPGSERTVRVRYRRGYAVEQQILQQLFFYEILEAGKVVDVERGELLLRYTYRYEMEHLLAAAGFQILSLAGDFDGAPYAGHGEQVWVVEAD
jgi:hypothetical protein